MTTATAPVTPRKTASAAQRATTPPAVPYATPEAVPGPTTSQRKATAPDAVTLLRSIDCSLAVIRFCILFLTGLVALGVILAGGAFLYGLFGPAGVVTVFAVVIIAFVVVKGIDRK